MSEPPRARPTAPWRPGRFSLLQLLAAITLVAVGCVALRNASSKWVAGMFALTLMALAAAALCAAFRGGHSRAFWIGFAACGWLYLLLLMYGWSLPNDTVGNPLRPSLLATTRLSGWAYDKAFPLTTRQYPTATVFPQGIGGGPSGFETLPGEVMHGYSFDGAGTTTFHFRKGPQEDDFRNVAHTLWTLLFAFAGGAFARWLYVTRAPSQ